MRSKSSPVVSSLSAWANHCPSCLLGWLESAVLPGERIKDPPGGQGIVVHNNCKFGLGGIYDAMREQAPGLRGENLTNLGGGRGSGRPA